MQVSYCASTLKLISSTPILHNCLPLVLLVCGWVSPRSAFARLRNLGGLSWIGQKCCVSATKAAARLLRAVPAQLF